ncbi:hypothetical protein HFO56_39625 [Rhizobium laguerreae]|uniref:hypothetical protein n=1 Tax=Rhizobium laguerreae TaxID=1076926 RepID=UPI001C9154DE|nr:hypothetical protein [Rhizobium laguerreae]MBY3158412.1 hypothetical protein [Rhizobium laguerreae]
MTTKAAGGIRSLPAALRAFCIPIPRLPQITRNNGDNAATDASKHSPPPTAIGPGISPLVGAMNASTRDETPAASVAAILTASAFYIFNSYAVQDLEFLIQDSDQCQHVACFSGSC